MRRRTNNLIQFLTRSFASLCHFLNHFSTCSFKAKQPEGVEPYKGLVKTGLRITKEEGFNALWKGAGLRMVRSPPQFAVTLFVYELLQRFFQDRGNSSRFSTDFSTFFRNVVLVLEADRLGPQAEDDPRRRLAADQPGSRGRHEGRRRHLRRHRAQVRPQTAALQSLRSPDLHQHGLPLSRFHSASSARSRNSNS